MKIVESDVDFRVLQANHWTKLAMQLTYLHKTEEPEPSFSQLEGKSLPNLEAAEEHPPRFMDQKCGPEVPMQPLSHPSGTYNDKR